MLCSKNDVNYFPWKTTINSSTAANFRSEMQPSEVTLQRRHVLIHLTSDFRNFKVSQLAKNGSLYLWIFVTVDKSNTIQWHFSVNFLNTPRIRLLPMFDPLPKKSDDLSAMASLHFLDWIIWAFAAYRYTLSTEFSWVELSRFQIISGDEIATIWDSKVCVFLVKNKFTPY